MWNQAGLNPGCNIKLITSLAKILILFMSHPLAEEVDEEYGVSTKRCALPTELRAIR
jgi:hypothetical protein